MMRLTERFVRFRDWRVWCGVAGELDARPPLICVPGGPGMSHDYIITLSQLADERAVIFYDPTGCGVSDRPANVSWSLDFYAEELRAICAAVAPGPFHLLSHSMASLIVLQALQQPLPALRSVILASPLVDVPAYAAEVRKRVAGLTTDVDAFIAAERDMRLRQTPAYARVLHEFIAHNVCRRTPLPDCLTRGFQLVNRAAHAQMKGGVLFYLTPMGELDMSAQLATLTVPLLVTCGELDPTTPESCRLLQSRAADCQLEVFPNCSHMPHLESSVAYAGVLRQFLAAIDRRPS